jgi:acyl-CoA synthetase (AMP-forming)/AMP-acid ligase II
MTSSETLWIRWNEHASARPTSEAIVHWYAEEDPVRLTWSDLVSRARAAAGHLAELGVKRGDVCAIIFRHRAELYPLYLGISALGAIPAVLAYPNPRLHADKFVQGLSGMAKRSGLHWLLTERDLEPMVGPLARSEGSSIRALLFPLEWSLALPAANVALPEVDPADPCLLQHSSGTTGLQKAVVLSHRAVLGHVERYGEAIGLRSNDKVVSWLPLYHDMGLIAAFQLSLAKGLTLVQLDPFEWVLAPGILLDAVSRERGTIAWLPNFAYNLMADRVRDDDIDGVRLDCVRLFVNCSEPVRADSHERFGARFAPRGLDPRSLSACYAMAETTFAVTQTKAGQRANELHVDRDALSRGHVVAALPGASARVCVSSGRPIRGCEVKVVDPQGTSVGEGNIGEIWIRSESMFDGYRNAPAETASAFQDGWYKSGDLGFSWEGELYVTARMKDIIIVAGKNLFPEDIEDAVGTVPGVLPGRVVAFSVDDARAGTEAVAVIAETEAADEKARAALKLEIARAGMAVDVTIGQIHLAPARWLVKSSSGKLSRRANRERLLAGALDGAWRKE